MPCPSHPLALAVIGCGRIVQAIRDGRAPLASGREVLPLMRVLDAARLSAQTGLPVSLGG